ncbi:MAG: threonylcarbamoyl-AMP synthase [Treponema sp.]|nr:threonylcarbamoyl-AMP synthase [Treponema sp.]
MICNKYDPDSVKKSASLLKNGEVLILPTDTVYGFSGVIGKTDLKIRLIKGRSETKPFIVLISEPSELKSISDDIMPEKLSGFWPGPLTVIVKEKNSDKTVAVRCPGDEWLRTVIKECGSPIYSTSVNRSGSPVLTKIEDICSEFESEVALIVSEGDSKTSVPSTIVKLEDNGYSVVREGAVKL